MILLISYKREVGAVRTTKLSSKGQIILPKSVRAHHKWEPGIEFAVEDVGDGVLLRPVKPFKATRMKDVVGCAGYKGGRKSLQDMERASVAGAKERK